jgi:hypothetical protein
LDGSKEADMTERPDPITREEPDDGSEAGDTGVDPTLRAETASDPEVAAMVRALTEEEDAAPGSDIRADVTQASENIGTGTDR